MNLTLVDFDDKSPYELIELLNTVVGELDEEQKKEKHANETPDEHNERVGGFLTILGFPAEHKPNFKHGDKKTVQNVLFWILQRPQDLKRIAYTAKFLVELQVPDEFQMDETVRDIMADCREKQSEFTAVHQNVEMLRQESMNPAQLKKEINQLESEKEQLVSKINMFKDKYTDEDFKKLLEATSLLRKEQETEAKYVEKQQEQQNQLDFSEQLFNAKHRLMEARKTQSEETSAEKMLSMLQREVSKNKDLVNEVLGRELQDKMNRYQKMEMLLAEPVTTQQDLEAITNEVRRLQRECMTLEDKLKSTNPAEDKLAIYKTQAATASKKKETKAEEAKRLETEKEALEKMMTEKEQEYVLTKGTKYMKRDDFRDFAMKLREKNKKYKVMKKELEEIRSELIILSKTQDILKSKAGDVDQVLKDLERKRGIQGYTDIDKRAQDVAKEKQQLDNAKEKSMEELTELVGSIESELKEKKSKLAPQIRQLRTSRQKYQEMEVKYNEKKKAYDNTVMNLESEKNKLNSDIDKAWGEYKSEETKYHYMNIQSKIYEVMQKRLKEENAYLKKPDARLSDDLKSFNELYIHKLKNQEQISVDLRKHQRYVKDNYENATRQVELFSNLKNLLEMKMKTLHQDGGDMLIGHEVTGGPSDQNVFIVRD